MPLPHSVVDGFVVFDCVFTGHPHLHPDKTVRMVQVSKNQIREYLFSFFFV